MSQLLAALLELPVVPELVPPVRLVALVTALVPLVDPEPPLRVERDPDAELAMGLAFDPLPDPDECFVASTAASAPPLDLDRLLPLASGELDPFPTPVAPVLEQAAAVPVHGIIG